MGLRNWWTLRQLPATCFISHAYDDADLGIIDALKKRLPRRVQPFIFPPIAVTPDQRVSYDLVSAIRRQQGLIHVDGPNSSKSVWVNFERDYALRLGLPVFSYGASTGLFQPDRSKPRDLRVFPVFSREDGPRIDAINEVLRERHFNIWDEARNPRPGEHWPAKIEQSLVSTLDGGGYLVVFLSNWFIHSTRTRDELDRAAQIAPKRILPVLIESLDRTLLPDVLRDHLAIDLYKDDGAGLNWNRVDDLMVRIYHMVHSAEGAGHS